MFHTNKIIKYYILLGSSLFMILLFISCNVMGWGDDTRGRFKLIKPPKLTFAKLTINKKTITKDELLKQIKEKEKIGFTVKDIFFDDVSFTDIEINRENFSLKFKKTGIFKITLTLEKKGFENALVEATIEYLIKRILSFEKMTTSKNSINKEDILKQIKGKKEGFTIKDIALEDDSFADIDKTNFSLKFKKEGSFIATIILEKKGFEDVTIKANIEYLIKRILSFEKMTTSKNSINKEDILKQVKGKKEGFTIKDIALEDDSFADIDKTNFSLKFKKEGAFTATIILEHPNHSNITLRAFFEKKTTPVLNGSTINNKNQYKTYFEMLTTTFPNAVKGTKAESIRGYQVNRYYHNVFGGTFANHYSHIHPPLLSKNINFFGNKVFAYRYAPIVTKQYNLTKTISVSHSNVFNSVNQIRIPKNNLDDGKEKYPWSKWVSKIDKARFSLRFKKAGTFNIAFILTRVDLENITVKATIKYLTKKRFLLEKLTTSKSTVTKEKLQAK